jgi:prepilin-type N-terminal cleavage/methylation domain-containing protein
MTRPSRSRPAAGFTLVELLISLAISAVIAVLTVRALVGVDRDQLMRTQVTQLQGTARQDLSYMEADLRAASLNAGTGVIWFGAGGGGIQHPSIQIYANLPGGGFLNAKAGTAALLVVEGRPHPRAAVVGAQTTSILPITVTALGSTSETQGPVSFAQGMPVLIGDYGDAAWGVVNTAANAMGVNQLTLVDTSNNAFPGTQAKGMASGASVRAARARLYFVNASDQLMRVNLLAPRAPATQDEILSMELLGNGFENMQLDCQLDTGVGLTSCPTALGATDQLSTEATAALGTFGAGAGPVLPASSAASLRTVIVNVAVRSTRAVELSQGDPKISFAGATPPPVGGASNSNAYVRRAYQLVAAIRNTSLGAL